MKSMKPRRLLTSMTVEQLCSNSAVLFMLDKMMDGFTFVTKKVPNLHEEAVPPLAKRSI